MRTSRLSCPSAAARRTQATTTRLLRSRSPSSPPPTRRWDAHEAISLLERLSASQKAWFDPDHRDFLVAKANLGLAYGSVGRTADAVKIYEEVVAGYRRKIPPTFMDTLIVTIYLADAYEKVNRLYLATSTYRVLLATFRPTLNADPTNLSRLLGGYGRVLLASKSFSDAELTLRECLKNREKLPVNWSTFDAKSILYPAWNDLRLYQFHSF